MDCALFEFFYSNTTRDFFRLTSFAPTFIDERDELSAIHHARLSQEKAPQQLMRGRFGASSRIEAPKE